MGQPRTIRGPGVFRVKSWLWQPHEVWLPSPAQSAKQRDGTQQKTSNLHGGVPLGYLKWALGLREDSWGVEGTGGQGEGVTASAFISALVLRGEQKSGLLQGSN